MRHIDSRFIFQYRCLWFCLRLRRQNFFHIRWNRFLRCFTTDFRRTIHPAESLPVHLSGSRPGHLPQNGESAGNHVGRQLRLEKIPNILHAVLPVGNHKSPQGHGAVLLHRDDRRLPYEAGGENPVGDFVQLHPLAVELHLMVPAAQVIDAAVRRQPRHIPGFVHLFPREKGVGQKRFFCQFLIADIPGGQAFARQIQLSPRRGQGGAQMPVKHVGPAVTKRPSDGDGAARHVGLGHIDRRLAGAVQVDDFFAAGFAEAVPQIVRQRLSG